MRWFVGSSTFIRDYCVLKPVRNIELTSNTRVIIRDCVYIVKFMGPTNRLISDSIGF